MLNYLLKLFILLTFAILFTACASIPKFPELTEEIRKNNKLAVQTTINDKSLSEHELLSKHFFNSYLNTAIRTNQYDIAKMLLESKKTDLTFSLYAEEVPYFEAVTFSRLKILDLLIEHGQDINFNVKTKNEECEEITSRNRHCEILGLNIVNHMGYVRTTYPTTLARAKTIFKSPSMKKHYDDILNKFHQTKYEYIFIIEHLEKKGLKLNNKNNFGRNVLYFPIIYGDYEFVEYLIKKGIPVNELDNFNNSPLDWLIKPDKSQNRYLEKYIKDSQTFLGKDVKEELFSNREKIKKLLLDNGAKSNIYKNYSEEDIDKVVLEELTQDILNCAAYKASMKSCSYLPGIASKGCEILVEAKFDNISCGVIDLMK